MIQAIESFFARHENVRAALKLLVTAIVAAFLADAGIGEIVP